MKKLLLVPTIIFPYFVCFCLFFNLMPENPSSFATTASIILFTVTALMIWVLSVVCNLVFIYIAKNESSAELLKTAFLVKLIHIPTYILIFILGSMFGLMFFITFPAVILLVIIDYLTLFLSGMISVYAHIKSLNEKILYSSTPLTISLICQMFFCTDIISLFVVNLLIKNNKAIN